MKRILTVIAMASVFAACNNSPKENATVHLNTTEAIKKAVVDSLKLDSFKRAEAEHRKNEDVKIAALTSTPATVSHSSTSRHTSYRRPTYVKGYSESQTYSQPTSTRKKGWSAAAKGAAIGGAAGAVTGILVDKKNGRGALIGGVVGAGTGYVIGRAKDRRTGRVSN